MGDKYGYLANPNDSAPSGNKTWLILAGLGLAGIAVWLIIRSRSSTQSVGKLKPGAQAVVEYTVSAPTEELQYSGAGMPFGIEYYEAVTDFHVEVDNNGIARLFLNTGIPGGIVRLVNGMRWFVSEQELNIALSATRHINFNILMTLTPYAMLGPGYLGYCTSGAHIGQAVYITLDGQIGRILTKMEGGELMFVPLEVIDQTPGIWSTFIKPEGGY